MDEIQICDFLLSLRANDVGQEHPWSFRHARSCLKSFCAVCMPTLEYI
jgi:hypothetical protein